MIDLHIHTKYSDGTDNIVTILKKAEKLKLKFISITDHNNCNAYKELQQLDLKKYYSGKIISGIELNTKILGVPIEILGYGIDTDKMNELTSKIYLSTKERNFVEMKRICKKCEEIDIYIPKEEIEKYDGSIYTSKYLHNILKKDIKNKRLISEECWENSNDFYRKYMSSPDSIFYIEMDDIVPNFEKVYSMVKETGGLVFIPHIYEYKENSTKILKELLKNYKFDGIECFYTTFSKEQTEYLLNLVKEKKLFTSGGSDYHGTFKPNVEIGKGFGNLEIPDKIINNWIELT